MVVEMKNTDLVLVDTPCTPQATKDSLDWLKAQFGERDVIAINGHHIHPITWSSTFPRATYCLAGAWL